MDTRVCKVCEVKKPIKEFAFIKNKTGHGKDGYYRWQCFECEKARIRKAYHSNIEYHRDRQVKYRHEVRHGLGPGGYDELLTRQNGLCAICRTDSPGANRKYFSVDHNHDCCPGKYGCKKCIRGLLCGNCNLSLGGFKDSIENLEAAIEYLRVVPNGQP